jgi:hypothetical protein
VTYTFDLHIHTIYSKDSVLRPSLVLKVAKKIGLSGIGIVEHKTLTKIKTDFPVISGCEVKTEQGEILGLFLNTPLRHQRLEDVLDEIKDQDGLIILPHPYRIHQMNHHLWRYADAIEVYNAKNFWSFNQKAINLAKTNNKGIIAGTDAHFPQEIGLARLEIPTFSELEDLRQAILKRKCRILVQKGDLSHIIFWPLPTIMRNSPKTLKKYIIHQFESRI